ncbi:TIGR01777 family oxidoreductase [Hymenobacter sp. BRD67]|uniref:TIGR01777 family oxidoreductase n=1 Tax=Hymenobacter sp. BRD67 TaxID=2675877 RepID=UPI001566F549|nr:TIGR01777 family oxidoreductase [Hymenobacter sp. BRD67]QKG52214.1 TIGR01777 family protein [Hymenobacter sp. BRD67]
MRTPKLVIAGGNGFLGRHLGVHFQRLGFQVISISRTGVGDVRWDARTLGPWAQELEGADLLVNLAGRTVDCRYTPANRQQILASRFDSTTVLGAAIAACQQPPRVWLNSSTATIYAHTVGSQPANTEAAGQIGTGFSVSVAKAWEAALEACPTPATRKVALRTSIVLGPDGGAFPVMARLARWGLCSPQGSGQQWISWLHIADFCRAIEFIAQTECLSGPVNVCAPYPLPNWEFNSLIANYLHPPLQLPQPRWLLEVGAFVLHTETELILKSRKVYPQRLLDEGFNFTYFTCESAMKDLLKEMHLIDG